ncbi:hypothetical protein HPP92_020597 [Vanilla planifolia]|uniref:Uncharacterized protein n=1 Tax=Vanilla planifolia TaxID=51239 RepID=A0A835Q0Z9_VANPL|nr:hypothetical protein HPP92_020597 [Vanilla planifolia]
MRTPRSDVYGRRCGAGSRFADRCDGAHGQRTEPQNQPGACFYSDRVFRAESDRLPMKAIGGRQLGDGAVSVVFLPETAREVAPPVEPADLLSSTLFVYSVFQFFI